MQLSIKYLIWSILFLLLLFKILWIFFKADIFGFGDDAKTPSLSATELEDEKSKFSFSKLVGGLIDNIVSFFGGMFDLDVKGIFKSIFGKSSFCWF